MFKASAKALLALWIMTWAGHAQAQWKTIPCSDLKFTVNIEFTKCQYERSYVVTVSGVSGRPHEIQTWAGYFHNVNSSLVIAVYTSDKFMILEDAEKYALGERYLITVDAYQQFLEKYPSRSQIIPKGKWLTFPVVAKAPTGNRTMNCLQLFKAGPPRGLGYSWTMVALMCVQDGEVPESAAELILNGIQVNLK
jgi:hypothetical protein